MYLNCLIVDPGGALKKLARTLSGIHSFEVQHIQEEPITFLSRQPLTKNQPELIFLSYRTIEQIADSSVKEAIDQIVHNSVIIVTNQRLIDKRFYYLLRHLCFLPADFHYLELMALLGEILRVREITVRNAMDEKFYQMTRGKKASVRVRLDRIISIKRKKDNVQLSLETGFLPAINDMQHWTVNLKYDFDAFRQVRWLPGFQPATKNCIVNLHKAVRIKGKALLMDDGEIIEIEREFMRLFRGKSELYPVYYKTWDNLNHPPVASIILGY